LSKQEKGTEFSVSFLFMRRILARKSENYYQKMEKIKKDIKIKERKR